MTIGTNKKDFERALGEAKDVIALLEPCMDEELLSSLQAVVSEYESHFSQDIEELMYERDELAGKIDSMEH